MIPKIFISYSWSSPNHEDWVINLAERLIADGVDVIIDKWDLKEGNDLYHFMESMVKSPEIEKVLLVLDREYSEKADKRKGGVGTEAQIISPEIYSNVSQEKFIPVITERDIEGNPYLPTFLKGRIYIDLSSNENFESNYENLLRNIYKRPSRSKPQIGLPPSYLFEESPIQFKTTSIVRGFDSIIDKNPNRINSILKDFLQEFYLNLKEFQIVFKSWDVREVGKQIHDNINQYTPLRDDFVKLIEKLTKNDLEFDIEIIIRFLEKLPSLLYPTEHKGSWSPTEFDNFRFITHELFLYLIAVFLKNEKYSLIEELLYSKYLTENRYHPNKIETFGNYYSHIDIMDAYYKEAYSKNFVSPQADFIIKRIPENFNKHTIVEADLLCYYVGEINHIGWFPLTYIYSDQPVSFSKRLISKRFFEKVKGIFGVEGPQDLKNKLLKLKESETRSYRGYGNTFDRIEPLYSIVDIENIASER